MLIGYIKSGIAALVSLIRPRTFVHLVGQNIDKADLRINGNTVDLAKAERKPATDRVSAYFTLKSGNTTYVLWNNPDAVQAGIQRGRKNHTQVGDLDGVTLDLRQGLLGHPLSMRFSPAAKDEPATGTSVVAKRPASFEDSFKSPAFTEAAAALRAAIALSRSMR
jgi:hypothetical protein